MIEGSKVTLQNLQNCSNVNSKVGVTKKKDLKIIKDTNRKITRRIFLVFVQYKNNNYIRYNDIR